MASPDRALLANLDVYFAEGNVRRGVVHLANNMLSGTSNGEFRERRVTVLRGTSIEFQSITGNTATILRCTKPVKLTVAIDGEAPVVFNVKSLMVLTSPLGDITVANESLTLDSSVQILQI